MANTVVGAHFQGGLKAPGAKIRSYEALFPSNADSYSASSASIVRIDIPALSAGTYIDPRQSFLRFRMNVSGQSLQLDHSAACVIRRLTVSSASLGTQLESINNYNLLSNILIALTSDANTSLFALSTLMGTSETQVRMGAAIGSGFSREFAIPLMSILGLFSDRCIPASGFVLELQLEDVGVAFVGTAGGAVTLDRIAYCASLHDLGPDLYNAMLAGGGGSILVPAHSYRNFQLTGNLSSSQSFPIGVRQSALKHVLTVLRRTDVPLSTSTSRSLSDWQAGADIASWQFRLGAELWPSSPVTGWASMFAQLQKCMHTFNTTLSGLIGWTQFIRNAAFSTAASTTIGGFVIGLDAEPASWQKTESMLAGVNTTNSNLSLDLVYNTAPTVVSVVDAFCAYDLVLNFSPGNQVTASA